MKCITHSAVVEIEAIDEEEAIEKAVDLYNNGTLELNEGDNEYAVELDIEVEVRET